MDKNNLMLISVDLMPGGVAQQHSMQTAAGKGHHDIRLDRKKPSMPIGVLRANCDPISPNCGWEWIDTAIEKYRCAGE